MRKLFLRPEDRLIKELNKRNRNLGVSITLDMVEFINPELWLGEGEQTNARVRVRAKPNADLQYFQGETTIEYNRLFLGRVLASMKVPGSPSDYKTTHDVLKALKSIYELPLESDDITDTSVTYGDSIVLAARLDSLGYYGSATLPYTYPEDRTDIEFLGEVPVTQLINGGDLAVISKLTAGSSINSSEPWLHFRVDGVDTYVAKKPYRRSISWDSLNNANVVYGNRINKINGKFYKVRLLKGANSDPTTAGTRFNPDTSHGSEWNRLMYPIHSNIHVDPGNPTEHNDPQSLPFGTFAQYTDSDLHLQYTLTSGTMSWCQERMEDTPANALGRAYYGVTAYNSILSSRNDPGYTWRPVLEHVDLPEVEYDDNVEFLGEVPVAELINGSDLTALIGLSGGRSQNSNEPWLHFRIDGTELFVARKPYRDSISWNQINNANAVYGDRIVTIKGEKYKVRLLKGVNDNPSTVSSTFDPVEAHESEWNRLMYPIHEGYHNDVRNPPNPSIPYGVLATYAESVLAAASGFSWCQETINGDEANRVARGFHGVTATLNLPASRNDYASSWRPVLEKVVEPPPIQFEVGPGPQTLIAGDETAGFYGEVDPDELITYDGLASKIGLTNGISQHNSESKWLKFALDGKTLFVMKKPGRSRTTWAQIHARGAVYGDLEIDIGNYRYRIRLLKGSDVDPHVGSIYGNNPEGVHNSEWNRLMYPIHSGVHTNPNNPTLPEMGTWAQYTDEDLHVDVTYSSEGIYSWCQETQAGNGGNRLCRGHNGITNIGFPASTYSYPNVGWRAVLELVVEGKPTVPGPEEIVAGDSTAGFYGEVAANQLISYGELSELVGLTSGTLINDAESQWLKFSLDGKTLFVPMKPVRHSITWDHLDDLDLVYGGRIVTIKDRRYVCRLFKGGSADPTPGNFGYNTSNTFGSEWNRLMYPIHNGVHFNGNNPTLPEMGTWAQYSDNDLVVEDSGYKLGSYTWCQETRSADASVRVVRGGLGLTRILFPPRNSTSEGRGWRPVLELVDEV